jgi:hypothetical protein
MLSSMLLYATLLVCSAVVVSSSTNCPCPTAPNLCTCQPGSIFCDGRGFPILNNATSTSCGSKPFSEITFFTANYPGAQVMPQNTFVGFREKSLPISFALLSIGVAAIQPGAFADMKFSTLKIASSSLATLHPTTFEGISAASNIDLSFSGIRTIQSGTFDRVPGLGTINLSFMTTHPFTIATGAFNGADSVTTLDVSNNNGLILEPGALEPLTTLTTLNLANSRGLSLPAGSFVRQGNLRSLSLSNCLLNKLHANTFTGLRNLQTLDLSSNVLGQVQTGAFTPLKGVQKLEFTLGPGAVMSLDAFRGLDAGSDLQLVYIFVNSPAINITGEVSAEPIGRVNADLWLDFGDQFWCIDVTPAICRAFRSVTMFRADLVCERVKNLCN